MGIIMYEYLKGGRLFVTDSLLFHASYSAISSQRVPIRTNQVILCIMFDILVQKRSANYGYNINMGQHRSESSACQPWLPTLSTSAMVALDHIVYAVPHC
jgi:hypothetical protein